MARMRYWKLTSSEMGDFSYPEEKLSNWEIKCIRPPEEEARFIGVFMYRKGTPLGYTPQKGMAYYYNNIDRDELPAITRFLKKRYGGEQDEKGERVFLKDSKEIYSSAELGKLATDLESEFNTKAAISLEFEDITEDEVKEAGLPESKLLPIPGK